MYIKDVSIDYTTYGHNTAVITLKDVDGKDVKEIRDMYLKGSDVTLVKNNTTIPFKHMYPPITIDDFKTARYAEGDTDGIMRYYKDMIDLWNRGRENVTMRNLKVEKVIFNEPATIVFWNDNSKTVAVCSKDDKYDAEKGFYICCAKKLFGNDFKAGGKINKALEKAIVQKKEAENDKT